MSRVTIVAPHLTAQAVKEKMKTAPSFWHRQKWLVVYRTHLRSFKRMLATVDRLYNS